MVNRFQYFELQIFSVDMIILRNDHYFDGKLLTADEVLQIADLPSREELLTKMLFTLKAPITNTVYLFNNILVNFINVLNAIKDNKTK